MYFESIPLYFERIPLYLETIFVYFATMLASGCIDNQYSKGKEKVVINIHFKDALCCWGYHLRLLRQEKVGEFPPQEVGQRMDLVMIFRPRGFTLISVESSSIFWESVRGKSPKLSYSPNKPKPSSKKT